MLIVDSRGCLMSREWKMCTLLCNKVKAGSAYHGPRGSNLYQATVVLIFHSVNTEQAQASLNVNTILYLLPARVIVGAKLNVSFERQWWVTCILGEQHVQQILAGLLWVNIYMEYITKTSESKSFLINFQLICGETLIYRWYLSVFQVRPQQRNIKLINE